MFSDLSSAYIDASGDARLMPSTSGVKRMRITINLDDRLLEEAQRLTGVSEKTAVIHEGLRALIERESARRLARLGGSEPSLPPVSRRRSKSA